MEYCQTCRHSCLHTKAAQKSKRIICRCLPAMMDVIRQDQGWALSRVAGWRALVTEWKTVPSLCLHTPQDPLEWHLACKAWWNKGLFSSDNWEYFCVHYNTCAGLIKCNCFEFESGKVEFQRGYILLMTKLPTWDYCSSSVLLLLQFLTHPFSWHLQSLHIFDNYIKFGLHVYIEPLYVWHMFDIVSPYIYFTETCNMKSN